MHSFIDMAHETRDKERHMRKSVILVAWVLWAKFTPLGAIDESHVKWQLIGAKTLETQCRQEAASLQSKESRYGIDGDRRYECLPVGLDPRR
jgi:hypothetical protein